MCGSKSQSTAALDGKTSVTGPPAIHALRIVLADGQAGLDTADRPGRPGPCHVRQWRMTDDPETLAACLALLSPQERQRAGSFLVQPARDVFIQVRALLRLVLGEHLGKSPGDIHFDYGRFRKPTLAGGSSDTHFNVAHSSDYALIAISQGAEVGVDIEHMRHTSDLAGLAAQILSPLEAQRWERLDDGMRSRAFFYAWTAKEAVSKAVGQGLQLDFKTLETGLAAQEPNGDGAMIHTGGFGRCNVFALPAPAGYSAALALRCKD
ncbi:4'-phosphopantetheinyl transferase family protein [Pollutimonas sp. M17]|uniref:4'-phosphopantetheinyl transferase family protein n=1 Tax=Pollutimonas sp. M17 TaxID=2962065 RepID=UPI0021F4B0A9|nr:4'-phosphopantetheinyl transferase superfamily protein [Pollutimonas sp. M17]UYO94894.1 4'-phosphopantetheinyl transferase superfamily protein [Pollutimonas sp. M17]